MTTDLKYFRPCEHCLGEGVKVLRRKKRQQKPNSQVTLYTESVNEDKVQAESFGKSKNLQICKQCRGTGIQAAAEPMPINPHYPHIAIIGAGIAGVALALACYHRGIPFDLYERDASFDVRSQGYGLTLQQAGKLMQALGVHPLKESLVSSKHIVHNTKGEVVAEWGMRKWLSEEEQNHQKKRGKRTNMHIARQSLRKVFLEKLNNQLQLHWSWQFKGIEKNNERLNLTFEVKGKTQAVQADMVVAADGIRSTLRKCLIDENQDKLRYLGVMVVLGICLLDDLKLLESHLLDSATVFQTANGHDRIYIMPYSKEAVMWQLSFPISESEAQKMTLQGNFVIKDEALRRCQWHSPIPEIIAATPESKITGYPVYDRALLHADALKDGGACTLIGDAAHPMSPFKGQGANQAIIDALSLARAIAKTCKSPAYWKSKGLRASTLNAFEKEMLQRSAIKVKGSAEAVEFLHSETVLQTINEPRGRNPNRMNALKVFNPPKV